MGYIILAVSARCPLSQSSDAERGLVNCHTTSPYSSSLPTYCRFLRGWWSNACPTLSSQHSAIMCAYIIHQVHACTVPLVPLSPLNHCHLLPAACCLLLICGVCVSCLLAYWLTIGWHRFKRLALFFQYMFDLCRGKSVKISSNFNTKYTICPRPTQKLLPALF